MYFTVFRENIKVFYVIVLRVSLHAGSQSSVLIPNYFSILSILRSRNVDLNLNFKNAICECNMWYVLYSFYRKDKGFLCDSFACKFACWLAKPANSGRTDWIGSCQCYHISKNLPNTRLPNMSTYNYLRIWLYIWFFFSFLAACCNSIQELFFYCFQFLVVSPVLARLVPR